jgi:hypothetical protein
MAKRGRKKKIDKALIEKAFKVASETHIDLEIYQKLGIGHESFYSYLREYTEFSEAIKRGKEIGSKKWQDTIRCSLRKQVEGYEFTKIKKSIGTDGKKRIEETIEYYPPVPITTIFVAKKCIPDEYGDNAEAIRENKDDDNFLEALSGAAQQVWTDEEE